MHTWGTGRKVEKLIRVEKGNPSLRTSILDRLDSFTAFKFNSELY